jgi:hypothetical protein
MPLGTPSLRSLTLSVSFADSSPKGRAKSLRRDEGKNLPPWGRWQRASADERGTPSPRPLPPQAVPLPLKGTVFACGRDEGREFAIDKKCKSDYNEDTKGTTGRRLALVQLVSNRWLRSRAVTSFYQCRSLFVLTKSSNETIMKVQRALPVDGWPRKITK